MVFVFARTLTSLFFLTTVKAFIQTAEAEYSLLSVNSLKARCSFLNGREHRAFCIDASGRW